MFHRQGSFIKIIKIIFLNNFCNNNNNNFLTQTGGTQGPAGLRLGPRQVRLGQFRLAIKNSITRKEERKNFDDDGKIITKQKLQFLQNINFDFYKITSLFDE